MDPHKSLEHLRAHKDKGAFDRLVQRMQGYSAQGAIGGADASVQLRLVEAQFGKEGYTLYHSMRGLLTRLVLDDAGGFDFAQELWTRRHSIEGLTEYYTKLALVNKELLRGANAQALIAVHELAHVLTMPHDLLAQPGYGFDIPRPLFVRQEAIAFGTQYVVGRAWGLECEERTLYLTDIYQLPTEAFEEHEQAICATAERILQLTAEARDVPVAA